ncbi:MAG: hypothetical protein NC240_04250 [Clostridium sp.]|nr:hypothetical protein [Clostridium sp.]
MEITICETSLADLKKIGFLIAIIIISFATGAVDVKSLYAVVLIQSLGNIDTFTDIYCNPLLNKKAKKLVAALVILSIIAGTTSLVYWYNAWTWMECIVVRSVFVIIVSLPVLFWYRDYKLNVENNR